MILKRITQSLVLLVLISILIIPSGTASTVHAISKESLRSHFFISFNSYVDIDFDPDPLNEEIPLDDTTEIPLTISYWTDIPENFLWFFPWQIRNLFLFRSVVVPMQTIHVEVVDPLSWATIYISQPDMFVNIPPGGSEKAEVETNLIIGPGHEAPAEPTSITVRAEVKPLGRLKGVTFEKQIVFTPAYVPNLLIQVPSPVKTPPNQTTIVSITITNMGNARTRVTSQIITELPAWIPVINPMYIDLPVDETETFYLILHPPENFTGMQVFELSFEASRFPPRSGSAVGGPYSVWIYAYYP